MGRPRRDDVFISNTKMKLLLEGLYQNVRLRRRHLGLSQQALASQAGLALNTVAEIEQARVRDICLSTLVALSEALGCELLELLTPSKSPNPK